VYRANFAEDRDIADRDTIASILQTLGQDAPARLAAAEAPDNKSRLRALQDEATARGIFGAPSFVVAGELFWGNDRLEDALAWAQRVGGGT
jgi:2-hydroxychromene-2-carboxylate isomerase